VLLPIAHANGFASAPAGESETGDAFHVQASAMSARAGAPIDASTGGGEDTELRNLLAGVAADAQRMMSGAYEVVAAEYAGKIEFARKTLPRDQAAGVIGALKAVRDAAFATIRQRTADELAGRREALIRAHRKPFRPVGGTSSLTINRESQP
jgi:hypothetical protein